jgi:glucan phosphorylase
MPEQASQIRSSNFQAMSEDFGGNLYPDNDKEKFSRLYVLVDAAVQRLEEMNHQNSNKPLSFAGI